MVEKKIGFAALTVGALSTAASAEPAHSPNVVVSWGDDVAAAARSPKAAGDITKLFRELGAPYQTYAVGDKTVYRWGQGVIQGTSAFATRTHHELLVTADSSGKILDSSYRPKFQVSGPLNKLVSMPAP